MPSLVLLLFAAGDRGQHPRTLGAGIDRRGWRRGAERQLSGAAAAAGLTGRLDRMSPWQRFFVVVDMVTAQTNSHLFGCTPQFLPRRLDEAKITRKGSVRMKIVLN